MSNIDLTQIITPDQAKATATTRLHKLLSELRWKRETEGVRISEGTVFQSDRTTRAELAVLVSNFELGVIDRPVTWKAISGWEVLGKDQLRHVLWLINAHVQACFAAEKTVAAKIDAGETALSENLAAEFETAFQTALKQ